MRGDELLEVTAGHVFHHYAVVPRTVEVLFKAYHVWAALAAGLHLDLLLDSIPVPLTFCNVRYNL